MQARCLIKLLAVALAFGSSHAGDWEPRDEAIRNLASGYAFMVLCSTHGYASVEPIARLGELYQVRMTTEAYKDFRDQYQRSLSEKKIYSIAGKRWIEFQINKEGCATADRSAEMYLQRLTPHAP